MGIEPITWEAFATLTTGALAVGAATVVALKQVAIVKRQTLLQELALRKDVFDKRMAIYRAVKRYAYIVMEAAETGDDINHAEYLDYYDYFQEARFLFSKRLYLELGAFDALIGEVRRSVSYERWHEHSSQEVQQYREETDRRLTELQRRYQGLARLFDPEMHIRTQEEGLHDYLAEYQGPDDLIDHAHSPNGQGT